MSQRVPCPSPASDLHTNVHNHRSSCVLTSAGLANMTRAQITKDSSVACSKPALNQLWRAWSGFSSDRKLAKGSVGLAGSRSPTGLLQDKSRTLRPVELTGSAAISARWRSVHFWTARCAFAQPIGNLRQHAACVQNGSFWRRAEARRVHGPLGERHARPPQPCPGSRYARPAPPAAGLDWASTARLFCFQAVMALRERDRSDRD